MIDRGRQRAYGRVVTPAPPSAQPQPHARRSTDLLKTADLPETVDFPETERAVVRPLRVAPEPGEGIAPKRSVWREWPIAIVVLGLVLGMVVVALGYFRAGAVTMSGAALMALFVRVLLPTREVGLLAVRSRWVDVVVLAMLAFSLALFAFWVPTPG